MGASNSPKTPKEEEEEFRVITGELYKSSDKELYIIKQLSEVRHKKLKGLYFLNQCTSNESQKSFFESESLPEACIIYFYTSSSGKPILKTYDEIEIFQPFKEKNFNKIVILSTYSSINDNISNLEVSNYIEKKGGLEFGMVLDFTKNEENLSQMENNFIKTTIKFTSENEQCSLRVNDIVWNGQSISSNVGDSIALRCKPMEGWCFCGWKFTRTYIENDQQKTEQIPVNSLSDINKCIHSGSISL